jgi:phospholipid/cholesterol/gamma-HCH transport system substrate-binding protein
MERNANYVAVGAFTLLVLAMAVAFVLWYRGANNARDYQVYEIYFTGSVSGLTAGSPVRYLGVDVGRVRRLSLNKERPDTVKVIVEVDTSAPVSSATRASLGLQGVTGLLYVNLKQGKDDATALRQGDRYPIIESQSSDIDTVLASLPELVARARTLIDNANSIFSDKNLGALGDTLANLRELTQALPQTVKQVNESLAQFDGTMAAIKDTATSVHGAVDEARPQLTNAMARVNEVTANLAATTQRLDRFMASSEAQVGHFSDQGLFEFERLLRDVRSAAGEFRELSRSLKENPAQLIYEQRETGVEIPK